MKSISLFSGVGGFELGFERAGIHTEAQVEQDKWCLDVLARHWPEVARYDDVRKVDASTFQGRRGDVLGVGVSTDAERLGDAGRRRGDADGPDRAGTAGGPVGAGAVAAADASGGWRPDLVYGGFPCQDVSVAGRRAGFRGERSSLWFEFERIVRDLRPRWVVIENVPGLLSSHGGADFGAILRGLADAGYGWAYRILDARWFGVPQRRRRVFIVGCLGDPARAAQVLAVCEGCGGYSAAGSSPRKDPAEQPPAGTLGVGRRGYDAEGTYGAGTLSGGGHPDSNMPGRHREDDANLVVGNTLQRGGHSNNPLEETLVAGSTIDDGMARPLVARATGYRMDLESETFIATPLRASDGHHGWSGGRGDGLDNLIADPISTREQKTYTHEGSNNFRPHNLMGASAGVRRLTPLECERLMGWPDGWTELTAEGKPIPDSHRYRMCGNGVVATVAEWIGHRLALVDSYMCHCDPPESGEEFCTGDCRVR